MYFQLGAAVFAEPKPMILQEFGIRTKDIYRKRFLEDYDDEDDEDEEEYDDPLNWTGSIEIDAIIYPTMKGTLDIDQEGPSYLLQSTISLPAGNATLYDELEFIVNAAFTCIVLCLLTAYYISEYIFDKK